mgnify:CR=1 FL=1|tara:strand:+ start:2518 stop:2739 length:222 start_codon:yes stop_codon:yes gene_type:complete
MSITSEYRKMHQSLKENTYDDINGVIKNFQEKLEPFIMKKDLNPELKLQLTDLNKALEKLVKGDLYTLRSDEE